MFRMGKPEADAAARVIMSKSLFRINSEYQEVNSFEREFKEKIGAEHCLCLSSGTGALSAALAALGVGPGDEVIVPGYTFAATAVAVLAVGAIPVIAEINETLTLDVDDVERKLSPHTRAVIPVHIQGFPCDMDRLVALAKARNFFIVEDACQADGGSYKGKCLGTLGEIGTFSFNYFKIISAGEGGALVTDDIKLFERAIIYHDCGTPFWSYEQEITEPLFVGINLRVSELTGAVMREQLKRLDGILFDLRRVKRQIMDATGGLPGIRFNPSNDIEGDCGTCLPFLFDDAATAERFENLIGGVRPINTGKHVYAEWSPVLEKRGAATPALNPYNNPLNKGLNMDFDKDSCPRTLDILRRSVYLMTHCDWTEAQVQEKIDLIRSAAAQL